MRAARLKYDTSSATDTIVTVPGKITYLSNEK